jgi:hypothetical protein
MTTLHESAQAVAEAYPYVELSTGKHWRVLFKANGVYVLEDVSGHRRKPVKREMLNNPSIWQRQI